MSNLIKREFINELVESVDIVDYIGARNDLKKKGANYFMRSPFGADKTPSFCVNPVQQYFKDFSSGRSGNVLTYIMEVNNMSFYDAVKELATYKGVGVQYESDEASKKYLEKQEKLVALRPILSAAVKKYREAFNSLEDGHPALMEIEKRKYDKETLIDWQIGFAPGNKFIYDQCLSSGVISPAKEIGLISDNNNDKYWNRLIYPIHDANDQLVGIAGRDLSGKKDMAKWINPLASDLYRKDQILFGLNKAKREISKTGNAWLVEGYNDVIAWHRFGVANTVAPCGTAITAGQINTLKKFARKITLCFDNDDAGKIAMIKHIPMILEAGMFVEVCLLPDCDPDEFVRAYEVQLSENNNDLNKLISPFIVDGFKFFMDTYLEGSESDKIEGVKIVSRTIAKVEDSFMRETYTSWLSKESKFSKKMIQDFVKEIEEQGFFAIKEDEGRQWPKGMPDAKKEEFTYMLNRYGFFQWNQRIWKEIGLSTVPISNFEIRIIQHMNDEKFPKKLVQIKNQAGKETVFDTESQNFNSLLSFKNAITAFGNYKFKGNNEDLDMVTDYLFDDMGVGRKIDILGWQSDCQAWVWNNGVTVPGKGTKDFDENGVFHLNDTTYYVPSANTIYKNSPWQYQSQKKFILKGGDISASQYFKMMRDVHREHAISGSLFALSSIFQDLISDKFHFFPILFLYGPASSGKSQLAIASQSLFGLPQPQINLGQALTTGKAMMREFAQFNNSIGILNEYKGGLPGVDDMIKGLWDRQGYKRGTLDSKVATEEVPILSSVLMTGNYYPTNEIVVSRIIAEEMTKDTFSQEEKKKFEILEDAMKMGVSRITQELIHLRADFEEKFSKEFRLAKEHMASYKSLNGLQERYFQNIGVLAATYELVSNSFSLPFTKLEMFNHFEQVLIAQRKRVDYSSTVTRFWDLFLVGIRGQEALKLKVGEDYKLEGNTLFIRYTAVYNRIQTEWWQRFQEACPSKTQLKSDLKDSAQYIGNRKSEAMAPGRGQLVTSVDMFDLKAFDNAEDMIYSIQVQSQAQMQMNLPNADDEENIEGGLLPF